MNILKTAISSAFVLAGALLAGGSAQAAPGCDSVSQIERRIVEHADGEVDVLRAFVQRMSWVDGIDMIEVKDNLDKWRAAIECHRQVASAAQAGAAQASNAVAQR